MAGVEAAGGAVAEDCREYRRRAALPPWLLLAVQLYAHFLLVRLCDEGLCRMAESTRGGGDSCVGGRLPARAVAWSGGADV